MADTDLVQHISIATPDLRIMSQPAAMDPDISATLSDFLSYTEHLPSAVIRSMTLIETLNRKAASLQKQIHDNLTTYSILPTLDHHALDAARMRRDISHAYEKLDECKRMSAAEAARIEDMVTRDARRLDLVSQKLKALPMPPSRDVTPDAVLTSPHLKRASHALQSADKRLGAQHRTTTAPRVRNRDKLMVPGEVLPPPNPDSPPPSEPDDWHSPPPPSPRVPLPQRSASQDQTSRQKASNRQKTPKPPRHPKAVGEKVHKTPRARPPGTPGTNAHSAVAGISTSNAIMALTKPPTDAAPGSKWLPWKRLTEFELAILRKRMKKNAAWRPSPAMRNRELKTLGRGPQAMEQAKQDADDAGADFIDEYDEFWADPTQTSISGEQAAEMDNMLGPEKDEPDGDEALINRGMRLNEAKKLKRERQKADELAQIPGTTTTQEYDHRPEKQDLKHTRERVRKNDARPMPKTADKASERRQEQKQDLEDDSKPPAATSPINHKSEDKRPAKPPRAESKKPTESRKSPAAQMPESAAVSIGSKAVPPLPTIPAVEVSSKKRKRDPSPPAALPPRAASPGTAHDSSDAQNLPGSITEKTGPERKKLRLNVSAPPPHDSALATLSPKVSTPVAASPRISVRPRAQRASLAPEQPPVLPPGTNARLGRSGPTITLRRPKAASAEPSLRKSARRTSNASLPGSTNESKLESSLPPTSVPLTSAPDGSSSAVRPKRNRRIPGVVTAGEEDGSAKVIIGTRKKPPSKKFNPQLPKGARKEGTPAVSAPEEEVDPDEERYCICGDVSWGTMIACDDKDVSLGTHRALIMDNASLTVTLIMISDCLQ